MQLGICRHCKSRHQRFYETDRRAKHRELRCLTCGCVALYVDFRGGVVRAGRAPSASEMASLLYYKVFDRHMDHGHFGLMNG